ncbi:aminotransferase class I/II-fold pyridoxal phosphate-dependent enzyme, partial [Candidatus Hydrogenedentota bacterium]
ASREIIDFLMRVKDSYNMNMIAQAATVAALKDVDWMRANARRIISTRERLIEDLKELGLSPYPSESNFVLVECGSPERAVGLFGGLKERNILVRYFDLPRVDSCLRITVGSDEETDSLLESLSDLVRAQA